MMMLVAFLLQCLLTATTLAIKCYHCANRKPCTTSSCYGDYCSTEFVLSDQGPTYINTCVDGRLMFADVQLLPAADSLSVWSSSEDESVVKRWTYFCRGQDYCQINATGPAESDLPPQLKCNKKQLPQNLTAATSCNGHYCHQTQSSSGIITNNGCGFGPMPAPKSIDPSKDTFCIEDETGRRQCYCATENCNALVIETSWAEQLAQHSCYWHRKGDYGDDICTGHYCTFVGQSQGCVNVSAPFDVTFGCQDTMETDGSTFHFCRCDTELCNQDALHAANNTIGSLPTTIFPPTTTTSNKAIQSAHCLHIIYTFAILVSAMLMQTFLPIK